MAKIITIYQCSVCNYEAGRKNAVRKHIELVHGEREEQEKTK